MLRLLLVRKKARDEGWNHTIVLTSPRVNPPELQAAERTTCVTNRLMLPLIRHDHGTAIITPRDLCRFGLMMHAVDNVYPPARGAPHT